MVFVVITFGPGSNKINEKMVRKPTILRSQPRNRIKNHFTPTRHKSEKGFLECNQTTAADKCVLDVHIHAH